MSIYEFAVLWGVAAVIYTAGYVTGMIVGRRVLTLWPARKRGQGDSSPGP